MPVVARSHYWSRLAEPRRAYYAPTRQGPARAARSYLSRITRLCLRTTMKATETCAHVTAITAIKHPRRAECDECVKIGASWVHLRTCQECGTTLCCDNSPTATPPNTRGRAVTRSSLPPSRVSAGCTAILTMPSRSTEEVVPAAAWPPLPLDSWRNTYTTLHLWTQVVGKLALALSHLTNHYWNTALQITPRGLATLPLTVGNRLVVISFDLAAHHLMVESSDGCSTSIPLEPRPVAEFYRLVMDALARMDIHARIWTMPVEVPDAIRFEADSIHRSYDPAAAAALWQ